jgi:integrase
VVGVGASPPAPMFGWYAERWLALQNRRAKQRLITIATLRRYHSALHAHFLPFFAARPLDQITRQDCDDFRAVALQVGLLPGTINNLMRVLRVVLRAAITDGYITRDPLAGMSMLPTGPRLVEPYTGEEINLLLAATPRAYRLLIGLAALAGLRQGEALALRHCDLDLPNHHLVVRRSLQRAHRGFTLAERLGSPKTSRGFRQVPIQSSLRALIDQHLEMTRPHPDTLLSSTSTGDPYDPNWIRNHVLVPAIREANLRPSTYQDLRRSFVAQCVAAGVAPAQTAAWLGHTIRMTAYYYSVAQPTGLAGIAALDAQTRR